MTIVCSLKFSSSEGEGVGGIIVKVIKESIDLLVAPLSEL